MKNERGRPKCCPNSQSQSANSNFGRYWLDMCWGWKRKLMKTHENWYMRDASLAIPSPISSRVSWPQVCRAWLVGEGTCPATKHLGRDLNQFHIVSLFKDLQRSSKVWSILTSRSSSNRIAGRSLIPTENLKVFPGSQCSHARSHQLGIPRAIWAIQADHGWSIDPQRRRFCARLCCHGCLGMSWHVRLCIWNPSAMSISRVWTPTLFCTGFFQTIFFNKLI